MKKKFAVKNMRALGKKLAVITETTPTCASCPSLLEVCCFAAKDLDRTTGHNFREVMTVMRKEVEAPPVFAILLQRPVSDSLGPGPSLNTESANGDCICRNREHNKYH